MVNLGKGVSTAMNARIMGSGGEAVILAHGYGGEQCLWERVVPQLAESHRVLVFDWCFSGAVDNHFDPVKYSSFDAFADDLINLVDEMNFNSSVFVGHSMAGIIGCIASIKRPHLFKKLVLIGSSPRYINSKDYVGGFENSDVEQIFRNIEHNFDQWAQNFASAVVDPNDPLSAEKFHECLKRMRPQTALSVAKLVFCSDERSTLEKVTVPSTIVQTANDLVVPNQIAYYVQDKIAAKSTVEIIDTVGHFPQLTAPLQLLEVLDRALGS